MTSLCRHLNSSTAQEIANWVTTADGCVHTATQRLTLKIWRRADLNSTRSTDLYRRLFNTGQVTLCFCSPLCSAGGSIIPSFRLCPCVCLSVCVSADTEKCYFSSLDKTGTFFAVMMHHYGVYQKLVFDF